MPSFNENLETFPTIDHVEKLVLTHDDGEFIGRIENKAGSKGSLRLYYHLWQKYGAITVEAAREGVQLYAEHTKDAQENPGKHPNIDRLYQVIASKQKLNVTA